MKNDLTALELAAREFAEKWPEGIGPTLALIVQRAQQIRETAGAEHFAEAWQAYPNKVAKDAARKAWVRMDGDQYFSAIMQSIKWRLQSKEWDPSDLDRRRFIPHFSTFLHQRRWLDPPVIERGAAHRDY
jgi:ABC-type nitrate/sulfonate/bicarbonate transport system substrate-binding protein